MSYFLILKLWDCQPIFSTLLVLILLFLALIDLQTAGNQNFYSVLVDRVVFTNSNSAMRVIMNYFN